MRGRRRIRPTHVHLMFFLSIAIEGWAPERSVAADREVLAMFRPGTLVLPAGSTGAPTEEVTIASSGIAQLFAQYGVDSVAKTFPNFNLADTLGVARTGEVVRLMNFSNIYTLVVPETSDRVALCAGLDGQPEVVYAHPNGTVEPCVSPNDPRYVNGDQWNLHNTGPDADIDAPEAWDITTGSAQTLIGIIDTTPVDSTHAEFSGKVTGETGPGTHGTWVAGIAAANTNNAIGIAGVDWHARIVAKDIDTSAIDAEFDLEVVEDISDALLIAGAQIINNSWTLIMRDDQSNLPRYSDTVEGVFSNAYKLNRISVAAMGNGGGYFPNWPAAFGQGVIAVGATDRQDVLAPFSDRGPHLDVCAPGVDVVTTAQNGGYVVVSGTSFAAPHVSGLAGLMLAVKPGLYNDDIEQIIRLTADDLGPQGWDQDHGTGRINARRALERLLSPYTLRGYTETGGTIVNSSALYPLTFVAVDSLADGQYTVRRHEVRKAVAFVVPTDTAGHVWGRGVATRGFSDEGSSSGSPDFGINFGRGWCEPVPGSVTQLGCTLRTFVYEVFDAQQAFVGWYPCLPESVIYAYAVLGIDAQGGGCPFVDTRTAGGWREENSVLRRSLTGALALDTYRLKFPPEVKEGRIQIRLRENEQEYTTLDEVRLVAVDHPPGVRAYAVEDRMVLGTRAAASRVTTRSGRDVTSLVSGLGGYYQGHPGDTLWVEMSAPGLSGAEGVQATQDDPGGPGILEGDPKETEMVFDDGSQPGETQILGVTDADVLSSNGILIEAPDGAGGWRPLTHYYPRHYRDETAVDSLGSGSLRFIFVGRHRLHFIGRMAPVSDLATSRNASLLSAHHSRLGDALAAAGAADGETVSLVPGDTLTVEFAAPAVAGQVREWFLLSRGVYSSTPSANHPPRSEGEVATTPARFALLGTRPNPFAMGGEIGFALPGLMRVRLELFDLQGRSVRVLVDEEFPAGSHAVEWNGTDEKGARVRPGVYLCRLMAGAYRAHAKLVVLRLE